MRRRERFRKLLCQLLRAANRVDDHRGAAARLQPLPQERNYRFVAAAQDAHVRRLLLHSDLLRVHRLPVRPCQKRIGAFLFQRFSARKILLAQIRADKLRAPFAGQRRRKEDHRRSIRGQPAQHARHVAGHIRVVGMHLVDNDRFARKAQMPEHQVFLAQCGEEQLINRAHHKIRQQLRFAPHKKCIGREALRAIVKGRKIALHQLHKSLVQLRFAMREGNGQRTFAAGGVFIPGLRLLQEALDRGHNSLKHGVRRRLRGQEERKPAFPHAFRQNLARNQRSLGFSHAHRRFQNEKARLFRLPGDLRHSLLHRVRVIVESFFVEVLVLPAVVRHPFTRELHLFHCALRAAGIRAFIRDMFFVDQRKEGRAACDPVGDDQKRHEKDLHGFAHLPRNFLQRRISRLFHRLFQVFLPERVP